MLRNFFKKKKDSAEKTPNGATNQQLEHINEANKDFDKFVLAQAGYSLAQGAIGEGSFSKVKLAHSKYYGKDVAIKIINRECAPNDFLDRFLPRELKLILALDHENICRYHDIIERNSKVYIAMDYAKNGDVLEYVIRQKYIEEGTARIIFKQILSGVKYLHSNKILHRDLKCENILLSDENRVLITDFGFAKQVENVHCLNQTYCGSSAYAPIEILEGMPYDGCAADVWSMGCILFIMTTGTMPYDDSNKSKQIISMRQGPVFSRTKQKISIELHILIRTILNPDVSKRPDIAAIENSKWCQMKSNKLANFLQPTPRYPGESSTSRCEPEASAEKKARHSLDF